MVVESLFQTEDVRVRAVLAGACPQGNSPTAGEGNLGHENRNAGEKSDKVRRGTDKGLGVLRGERWLLAGESGKRSGSGGLRTAP